MKTYGPYDAVVRDIHDGDTLGVDIDLGFAIFVLTRNPIDTGRLLTCRLHGINAPELSTAEGKLALAYLMSILPVGAAVKVTSHGWDRNGGRFDGEIVYRGESIADLMVAAGHAVVWDGHGVKPVPAP